MNRLSPTPTTFTVGYHDIHPDVSINYQLNRFSDGSAPMVAEMRGVAARDRRRSGRRQSRGRSATVASNF